MKKPNRSNRKRKYHIQGYKNYETGESHAPLNNHDHRCGTAKIKRQRKCHCKEACGGSKSIQIAEKELWKTEIKDDVDISN